MVYFYNTIQELKNPVFYRTEIGRWDHQQQWDNMWGSGEQQSEVKDEVKEGRSDEQKKPD